MWQICRPKPKIILHAELDKIKNGKPDLHQLYSKIVIDYFRNNAEDIKQKVIDSVHNGLMNTHIRLSEGLPWNPTGLNKCVMLSYSKRDEILKEITPILRNILGYTKLRFYSEAGGLSRIIIQHVEN